VSDDSRASAFAKPNSYIGRTLTRAAAKRVVAGRGRFTDDFAPPRMLHAAFLRSPMRGSSRSTLQTPGASQASPS